MICNIRSCMNVASFKYEILYLLFLGYSEHKLAKKMNKGAYYNCLRDFVFSQRQIPQVVGKASLNQPCFWPLLTKWASSGNS